MDSGEPEASRTYQALVQEVGLVDAVAKIMVHCPMKVFFFSPVIKTSTLGKEVIACGTACHRLLQVTKFNLGFNLGFRV